MNNNAKTVKCTVILLILYSVIFLSGILFKIWCRMSNLKKNFQNSKFKNITWPSDIASAPLRPELRFSSRNSATFPTHTLFYDNFQTVLKKIYDPLLKNMIICNLYCIANYIWKWMMTFLYLNHIRMVIEEGMSQKSSFVLSKSMNLF